VSDPTQAEVGEAVADVDLVVIENVCSLPLHPPATAAVAAAVRGRPAVLHHHDLPWQRERFAHLDGWPPDDPAWRHVTINDLSRRQLADRGIHAVTIRPVVDDDAPPGGPTAVGLFEPGERVLLHPVRAIERKDVPAAVRLAEALDATYWLTGPAEEGYDVAATLAGARCRVVHERVLGPIADAYAAADAVAFPSRWEGFGVPVIEAALHRRPLAIRRYPVADELAAFGFTWFPHDDPAPLAAFLDDPDDALLDRNETVARTHFSPARLDADLTALLRSLSLSGS
jgi:glycosyltransferase involved in cell wall biosynthesis